MKIITKEELANKYTHISDNYYIETQIASLRKRIICFIKAI